MIRFTSRFKRDFKREKRGPYKARLETEISVIINLLEAGEPLPDRYRDHALTGDWNDHRDCHLRPDLVLIYRLVGEDEVELVRLGSHAELGL